LHLKQDFKYTWQSQRSLNYGVTSDTLIISLLLQIDLHECVYVHASAGTHVCIQMAFAYPPAKFQ